MLVEQGRLEVKAATDHGVVGMNIPLEQMAISTEVVRSGLPVYLKDIADSPFARVARAADGSSYRTGSVISLPLKDEGVVVGVLNLSDKVGQPYFDQEDLEIASAMADQVAALINFSALHSRLDQTYQDLGETQRAKQELMNMIFHDMKAPLTAIKEALGLLSRDQNMSPAEKGRYLSLAELDAELLWRRVTNLMDLNRMESGQMPVRSQPLDLCALAEETIVRLSIVAGAHSVKLNMEVDVEPDIMADEDLVERILANILINAMKFSSPDAGGGGTVSVRLGVDDRSPSSRWPTKVRAWTRSWEKRPLSATPTAATRAPAEWDCISAAGPPGFWAARSSTATNPAEGPASPFSLPLEGVA